LEARLSALVDWAVFIGASCGLWWAAFTPRGPFGYFTGGVFAIAAAVAVALPTAGLASLHGGDLLLHIGFAAGVLILVGIDQMAVKAEPA
jgi:hypothetical protein